MASVVNPVDVPQTLDPAGSLGDPTFEIKPVDAFDLLGLNEIILQIGILGVAAGGSITVEWLTSMQNDVASSWQKLCPSTTYSTTGYTLLRLPELGGTPQTYELMRYFRIKITVAGAAVTFTIKGIARQA